MTTTERWITRANNMRHKAIRFGTGWLFAFLLSVQTFGLEYGPNDVYVRVIDVGQGHCAVICAPNDRYVIYDAGIGSGEKVFNAISKTIPTGSEVDLMVISHTDADHLAAVPEILRELDVKTVWRPDRQPDAEPGEETEIWQDVVGAIEQSDCEDPGLDSGEISPGTIVDLGDAVITMICGFTEPPDEWGLSNHAERRNAGSIVIRLEYQDKAVLFCGDSVGRHNNDDPDACIAAEAFMVEQNDSVPLRSDVIIAPHHGADNGSSTRFIETVKPKYVIFPAGHHGSYRHPRASAAERYLEFGVDPKRMLRTDLNDDEGDDEWDHGRISGRHDKAGDDDIEIVIREDGKLLVEYANPGNNLVEDRFFAETRIMMHEMAPRTHMGLEAPDSRPSAEESSLAERDVSTSRLSPKVGCEVTRSCRKPVQPRRGRFGGRKFSNVRCR
jgi:competence protein ComEC